MSSRIVSDPHDREIIFSVVVVFVNLDHLA